jgi:hypothetical protein
MTILKKAMIKDVKDLERVGVLTQIRTILFWAFVSISIAVIIVFENTFFATFALSLAFLSYIYQTIKYGLNISLKTKADEINTYLSFVDSKIVFDYVNSISEDEGNFDVLLSKLIARKRCKQIENMEEAISLLNHNYLLKNEDTREVLIKRIKYLKEKGAFTNSEISQLSEILTGMKKENNSEILITT